MNSWLVFVCICKKCFKVLMEDVGDQVSPTKSLFCRSLLTKILCLSLSKLPSYCILPLYTSMHGVTGSSLSGSSMRKVLLLTRSLISFRFDFSQGIFSLSQFFSLQQSFWVLDWSVKLLNQILPNLSILAKYLLQQSKMPCVNLSHSLRGF